MPGAVLKKRRAINLLPALNMLQVMNTVIKKTYISGFVAPTSTLDKTTFVATIGYGFRMG